MGVKTRLDKTDLKFFKKKIKTLKKTSNGASDTVYIVNDKYVLKLFEKSVQKDIKNEIKVLKLLKNQKVSKLYCKKIFTIKNKPSLMYKKCDGDILKKVQNKHIEQLAKTLKKIHQKTKNKTSKNKQLFCKNRLKKLILKTSHKPFLNIFKTIKIDLKNDGIIHGDIFVDNVIFQKGKLSCVCDFSESCNGDFLFDLAVVALSWCKDHKQIKLLLKSYGTNISYEKFQEYIKYARLYYSVTRFLDNRDYKELFDKISR